MTDTPAPNSDEKRDRIYIRPTLIIGLGGSGARVATELKARLEEQLGERSQYGRAIRIVCFDTANETFKASKPNTPGAMVELQAGSEFIRISDVPLYDLNNGRNANPAIASILPETLHSTQIDQGAQQVRRLGRVALFFHYNLIKSNLNRALQELRNRNRQNPLGVTPDGKEIHIPSTERTRVYIISSICGGTGSGTFLDIAYLVRHFSKSLGPVDVHGMLLLPEAFPEVGTTGEQRIRANAYAALLDLEYYNQATADGRPLYHVEFPGDPVQVHGRPFTNCYLLNDATIGGTAMYAPLLAEILQVMITSRVGEQLDATLDNIRGYLNVYHDGFRAFYSGIGLSQLVMPRAWQRQVFTTELQKTWVNEILLADKGENWGDNNSPSAEAERFFTRQSDIIKSTISEGLKPILEDNLPVLSALRLDSGDSSQLSSQLQLAFNEVETVFRNRLINNIENQARDALTQFKKALREAVKTHVNAVSDKQNSRGLVWARRWLRGLEKLLNEKIQAENNRLSFNQRAQQVLNRNLTALRTTSNIPYLGGLQANRAARAAKHKLVDFFRYEITSESALIGSHVVQCYTAVLPLIEELDRDLSTAISAWRDWVNQRSAPPAPNLAPLMISAITVEQERENLQKAARQWAQETATTEIFNPRTPMPAQTAGIGELYDSISSTQRMTIFTAFENYSIASYIRYTRDKKDELKASDAALKALGEQAKPLTGYEKGLLKSELREVKAFGAQTRSLAEENMQKTGITHTDLSSVETGDADRFQLFLTVHGIPAYALKGFTEYKRNYDALSARPDDPNSRYGIFHLDNERENSPYDPQSINFINLEDFEMRFARALAYRWITCEGGLFTLDGDTYGTDVFVYPPAKPFHELNSKENLSINLYDEMSGLALKKHAELSNRIQSAKARQKTLADDDPEKLKNEREIDQIARQLEAIERYFVPATKSNHKASRCFLLLKEGKKDKRDKEDAPHYIALTSRDNQDPIGSLAEPLDALYADEERLLPDFFIHAFDAAYERVISHERTRTISSGETLAERVDTFLNVRGIIGQNSSQLWFSQTGQADRVLEERLCSMLLVYHRSTQRQINGQRYYHPDAVRAVRTASDNSSTAPKPPTKDGEQ